MQAGLLGLCGWLIGRVGRDSLAWPHLNFWQLEDCLVSGLELGWASLHSVIFHSPVGPGSSHGGLGGPKSRKKGPTVQTLLRPLPASPLLLSIGQRKSHTKPAGQVRLLKDWHVGWELGVAMWENMPVTEIKDVPS